MADRTCFAVDCESVAKARGFCMKHYHRFMRGLPLDASYRDLRRIRKYEGPCIEPGCAEAVTVAKKLCKRHYYAGRSTASRAANPRRWLGYQLSRYGLTPDDYDRIFDAQDGRCAICSIPASEAAHGRLVVDHNYTTGRVRGLLCSNCNCGIGHLKDDAERTRLAGVYLEADGLEVARTAGRGANPHMRRKPS